MPSRETGHYNLAALLPGWTREGRRDREGGTTRHERRLLGCLFLPLREVCFFFSFFLSVISISCHFRACPEPFFRPELTVLPCLPNILLHIIIIIMPKMCQSWSSGS